MRKLLTGLIWVAAVFAPFADAAAATLDWEGLPDGSSVGTPLPGIHFTHAMVLTAGLSLNELEFPPHSGVNVVVDDSGPMVISFATPVLSWTAFATYTTTLHVEAFDAGGTLLAQTASAFASNLALSGDPGSHPNEALALTVTGGFSQLRVSGAPDGGSFVIDDMTVVSVVPEPATPALALLGLVALGWRLRRRLISVATAAALAAVAAPVAAQDVGQPLLSPAAVHIGATTTVRVSARIGLAGVLPNGVNVLRVAPGGQASVVGSLNDTGIDGDVRAGDGQYGGRIVLNESIEGPVALRLSVAVRGSLRRVQSAPASLAVVPVSAPLTLAPPDLTQRAVDAASGAAIVANIVNVCFVDSAPYATVAAAAGMVGASVSGRFSEIGNCHQFLLGIPGAAAVASAVATLAARADVRFAEPEAITHGEACSGPICADPNFATVLHLPQAQAFGTGAGVVVGILDSGLDASRIPGGFTFPTAIIGSNFSNTGSAASPADDNGHGTLVAYIVQASAPDATLFIAKVLNASLEGSDTTAFLGIREAVANGVQILNLSLGSRLQSFAMREMLTLLNDGGITIVAAAGNDGSSIREYPAAHIGVVAVGNVNDHDRRHAGVRPSNFGPWVNIAAPGVNVASSGDGGTGSSFSAPFVAATAALVKAKFPRLSRPELIARLTSTALPIPAVAGADTCPAQPCNQDLGSGRLDPEAAMGAVRITRSTSVGASGAAIARMIEIEITTAAGAVLFSETRSFLGQSTGCEVSTVRNPPCIASLPFDFAALPAGTYRLRLSFRDPSASFFGVARLNAPGAIFSAVQSGTAFIHAGDATQADFSLFGAGVRTVFLQISKS